MAQKNRRIPLGTLLIRTAAVLFCLVMITTYLTAGLYARYTASGKGTDSARVAKFDVTAVGVEIQSKLDSVGDGEYKITVTNDSEVAVRYGMVVELEKPASYVSFKLDKDKLADDKEDLTEIEENKSWQYIQVGTLAPGNTSAEHTLTMVMDWSAFTAEQTLTETTETDSADGVQTYRTVDLPFKVKVHAEQVD